MKRIANGFGTVLAVLITVMAVLPGCPTSSGGGGGDDNTPLTNTCKCTTKEHKYDSVTNEKCCEGSDCKCRIYYGEITGLMNGTQTVRVYKETGATITNEQMVAAIANLQAGYNANSGSHSAMNDKIKEIHIFDGSDNYYYDNQKVFGINYIKGSGYMGSRLVEISNGGITEGTTSMLKQAGNAVKMANVKTPSKLFVAFERANNRRARSIVNNSRMNVMRG